MKSGKVLLVEDNPDEEELARIAFRRAGLDSDDVVVAHDGQEAVDYLFGSGAFSGRDVSQTPKVVFLDINMPKMNGLEVLKRIKSNEATALIPTVILTSSDELSDQISGYRFGANSYVRKALDFKEFIENIILMRHYWIDVNCTPTEKSSRP
ncbi:MAG: response regulator [Pseudomonadales bacterium]|uniref:CheY-like receiver protein n=1 Tax=Oleiphilus messinensis TaxID=141451 RepID=A0A1Y0I6I4_9GAMM|nr:response regulator [Oleiphilus messinensis]ARU56107.1 CheY-like receiver protein [Oleiphilus messinensis]MCG8610610.1 response regulator [Pseudomonadales bacterium]